jgi:ribonuclease Z
MGFSVTILGSGAALPTPKRGPSSQYVECNGRHILIDCGEGTQNAIRKNHIHLQKITHILISHLHGDHYFGLVGLLSTMHLLGRDKGIVVYGPKELEQIVRLQLEVGGARLNFSITFIVLNPKDKELIFEDKQIEIFAFPLIHRIPTTGFQIKEKPKERPLDAEKFKEQNLSLTLAPKLKRGENVQLEDGRIIYADDYTFAAPPVKSYSYCSDTKYDPTICKHIFGSTMLYHEATFLHQMLDRAIQTFHTTAQQAALIAQEAKVRRLLLGHLSSRYETGDLHLAEAKQFFENTLVVEDGDVYKL